MSNANETPIISPMPGKIVECHKSTGNSVIVGETIITIESMKMEIPITSPVEGVIKELHYKNGDTISKDDVLCLIG